MKAKSKPVSLFAVMVAALLLVLIPSVHALPTSGSLYISIPNASEECANLVLPDDGGYFGPGAADYIITMVPPDTWRNWGGISEQVVTTDFNNTVIVPLCFSSFGRALGTCSEPFTIRLSAPSIGLDKFWEAGMCASEYLDFDTGSGAVGSGAPAPDSMTGLDDADVFSIGFSEATKYAKPAEAAEFTLWVESYAELDLDFSVQGYGGIAVSPSTASLSTGSTGPDNSFHELNFTAGPVSQEKTYSFTVTATAQGCGSGSLCARHATAELVVGQQEPELAGFLVTVFPENINVRDIRDVMYRLTINNFGESDQFSIDASLPEGLGTTFAPTTITVPSAEYRTLTFTVTPSESSSAYELGFTVTSGSGVTKPVTAYMSTNELLTDAQRSLEAISQAGDSQSASQADDEISKWYRSYQDSAYGQGLEGYSTLQSGLQAARQDSATGGSGIDGNQTGSDVDDDNGGTDNQNGDDGDTGEEGLDLFGKDAWILLVIVLVILGAAFFFAKKRGKKGIGMNDEIDLDEGF